MPFKLVDHSEFIDENGKISAFNRIQGNRKYGSTWVDNLKAQEKILQRLEVLLNDRYSVLRNLRIPGVELPIPLTIIGPPGVQIIYPCSLSGFYEAKGANWSSMNRKTNAYTPSQPNPIARSLNLKEGMQKFLLDNEFNIALMDPVILFTDPHIHIESNNPALRIVLVDAMNKYILGLANPAGKVPHFVVQLLTDTLTKTSDDIINPKPDPTESGNNQINQISKKVSRSFRFSSKQWIAIFGLSGFAVLLSIILIVLFFVS